MEKISTIITAYDHHSITVAHVRECMNTTRLPDEIIVVNDGGDPSLKEMLKKLEIKTKLIYARINEDIPWNYNGACNLAVWLSKGDFLVFEDNDNIPHKDTYGEMLKVLTDPKIGRVTARIRHHVSEKDLEKSVSEWEVTGNRGPNQGTYMIRREIYTLLKGQDERMCGRYGWMYYDWKRRLLNKAKTTFGSAGSYYYVLEGQSNLERKNSSLNRKYLRENSLSPHLQPPSGIVNFTYTVDEIR